MPSVTTKDGRGKEGFIYIMIIERGKKQIRTLQSWGVQNPISFCRCAVRLPYGWLHAEDNVESVPRDVPLDIFPISYVHSILHEA